MDTPGRAELVRELEAVRQSYTALVGSMSESDWTRQSRNPDFVNRELIWHIAWSMTWLANGAEAVRAQRRPLLSRLPGGVMDPLRRIAMHRLANKATPERAVQKYDEGHAALLDQLKLVTADEWQLDTVRFGVRRSLLWHFQQPAMHFNEHRSDIELAPTSALS